MFVVKSRYTLHFKHLSTTTAVICCAFSSDLCSGNTPHLFYFGKTKTKNKKQTNKKINLSNSNLSLPLGNYYMNMHASEIREKPEIYLLAMIARSLKLVLAWNGTPVSNENTRCFPASLSESGAEQGLILRRTWFCT